MKTEEITLTPAVFDVLAAWINQKPGLDFRNYGDITSFNSENAKIKRQGAKARALLATARLMDFKPEVMAEAFDRAFSGRLSVIERDGGLALDYCTGQYWPTEYRLAAAAVLERYIGNAKPIVKPTPGQGFTTISQVAAANSAAGHYFFEKKTKKFFSSRIFPTVYAGDKNVFFVTSERKGFTDYSRGFTVRAFDVTTADVNSVSEFNGFRSAASARVAAKELAKRDRAGHAKPQGQGDRCEVCGHYRDYCNGQD